MSTLYILCGAPGCGKSNWAKNFIQNKNISYVSRDVARFQLVAENEEYFAHEDEVFKNFIEIIVNSLKAGVDTIADATHINRKSRAKLIRAIDKYTTDYQIIFVHFTTSCSYLTCCERNNQREGREKVPEDVIKNMCNVFERPTLAEDNRCYCVMHVKG